jgi:glutaredoxin
MPSLSPSPPLPLPTSCVFSADSLPADDGSAMQSVLADMTGQSTVPNIFIAQKHIGGNSDLQAKKSELTNLLKEAGAA